MSEPARIRNVAVVGHRGTGKTSLVEALLFQAGKTNRLGTVDAGTTVSDWDEDEQRRQMSLAASLCNCEWQGRKINLIDTPGDSGFQADTVVPASTAPRRLMAPVWKRSASTSDVFPVPRWPTTATLRILPGSTAAMRVPPPGDVAVRP